MASTSVNTHTFTKETTNYARLCRLLVDVGTQVLRETFDKIHPPASLHDKLSSHPVRASLERFYKGKHKILNSTQWEKLYPSSYHSPVSSGNFDATLLMVLLRTFSGLKPPATGWNKPPPATDTSTEADIIRVRVFRNEIYHHARKASVDDHTFNEYWQDIQQTLIRLGGERYGPFIDKLKVDCMDPDIELHYQELLKQWIEEESKINQIEGNVGCLYAETVDISLLDPTVDFKSMSQHWTAKAALRAVIKYYQSFRKRKAPVCSRPSACGTKENPLIRKELNFHEVSTKNSVNRITSGRFQTEETRKGNEIVVALLDEAINLQQSDHIAASREKLQYVFQTVRDFGQRFFSEPTIDGLRVLRRGKDLFLEDSVCCSVKHGTLLLDSSDSETQFYGSLLNVIGAFAVVISEFKMAEEIFSLLIAFHQQSAVTCRKRDLGAAYNNTGCISLILGNSQRAEDDFKTSLEHLESAKERHQQHRASLETMSIAINSNIGRLNLISRNYSKALEEQVLLVETCKSKDANELPLQVVFTLLNNLTVLYTTLGKFGKAEQELKWMVSYCYKMNREDCDYLLNFVALYLSEVLLLHGKPKEADKVFPLDVDDIDLVEMFGGLHINVRIETVEKLVDVIVLKGKIRLACELLERGVKILESTFGPDHFNVASLLYNQGTVLALAGEVSSAVEKFKCSMKILEEIFGIMHPLLLKCYMSLGELALRSKRADESYLHWALRSKRADELYSHFQRAMENIEAIYQVSFVNQLSRKYLEITSSNTFHQSKMQEDTCKIEGLVAEHGVVLAVLLSRSVVQDDFPPLRRTKTNRDVQCPDSKEIVSFKYSSDFLQTGQLFLRQGMKKEAAAFFQKARKYSMALDATRGPAYACIARLFDVLTEKRLGNRETLENNHEMLNCLKELNEVSAKISNESSAKRSTDATTKTVATATATFDDQLNVKLVLIFLILLSIEMKMIDTTFAAYDLYSRISQKEDGFLHVVNGEVQVYASKTSITCNGITALQDVLVSSKFGLNETEPQRPLPDDELYRSLAVKKNVQADSFLVAYTSPVFLDIEELRALDRQVSLSVQECFQQKCFKTGVEDSATQVVVDLTTTTSTCDHHNVLLTGSRVELLPLCLLQGAISEIPQAGNISEISTAMCQKTFCLAFEDEQTSYFMFSKNALYLQQCSSVKFSTLSVQHHCLSLTITHPVKARVTLWRKDKTISQRVQLVQTKRHDMVDWTVSRQGCSADLVGDFAVAETLFLPTINRLANIDQVPCKTIEYSDEPPDVSDMLCEQSGFLLDGRQRKERKVEKSEVLRNNLNAITLETLTNVSELSSQLREDAIQEGDNDFAVEARRVNISPLPTSSQSQFEQEVTSSECNLLPSTLTPEANIQSRHSSFEAPNLAGEEGTPETHETYPTFREEEDDNLLGRRLFEKDRDSRHSLITELYHEMTRKSNLISQEDGPSDEVTEQVGSRVIDSQNATTCHTGISNNQPTSTDITDSSFENWTLNPTVELRAPNLTEEQSKPDSNDDEDALERHLLGKDTQSTGSSTVESKRSKKEQVLPTWNNKIHANEDSVKDQGLYENQQFESSPVPGQSARFAKDKAKKSISGTAMHDSKTQISTDNVTLDNQYQSNYLSSTYGETQHLQDVIERQTKHTLLQGEKHETISPMQIGEEYIFQRSYERESRDGHDEPLVNKDFPQALTIAHRTKREKSRSSFSVYDDTVPDGPIRTSNGMHNTSNDLMASRYTDVVDGPLKTVGSNLQIQSGFLSENANGMLRSRIQIVDETHPEEVHPNTRRNDKLRASQQSRKGTSFCNPQLAFLGGDVLVDGAATDSPRKEDKLVNGSALTNEALTTCKDGTKRICENEKKRCPLDSARDAVDGPVYSLKGEDPRGFGGARPKQISPNSTRRNWSSKTKVTEPISTYQHNETGEIGLEPGFLARHTVKSNGAVLDLPRNEPYFSAQSCKNITYGDKLQLPGERINPPGYRSISSSQGLHAQGAFAARTYTQGIAQAPAIHQEPSLHQKESWHFPPAESANGDQGVCVSQQNASQSENFVKALFSSHGSRSAYDEMDSMSDEYQNSMGNFDNGMVKSPAASYGHYSSTKYSTSSLLGSLQQIMSKTVNLVASSNLVAMQPQKKPKEAVKLSIQEEARGSREQEQAVRTGVEDSKNQEESTQDNGETKSQPILTPVQETPRPVCSHYQRRCLVRFPCCGKYYPCHRCHNESKDCSDDQARATNATHIRCSICYHEQVIDEQSQTCGGCKSKMSEYFCSTCKHFTSVDKNPFHCDKCGICRIHRDRSFHCDVCNVCLDKRLQGKHKCRPDSGHDECCICLEDAFSGCQILPCSHKVHKDCAIAMIQNGVRSCPICRHPLFSQPQNSPQ